MALRILDHPLASHLITHLRDRTTKPALFRNLSYQITTMLALEATREMESVERSVETPLEPCIGRVLAKPLVVVPILRAGLGMLQPFQDLFPDVSVGYLGLERDHDTAAARAYYSKLPALAGAKTIVVDPMLATGGSACHAMDSIFAAGADHVSLVCIIGSREGVGIVRNRYPSVDITLGVMDEGLNASKYIVPGLGDFGDRLYGTSG